MLLTGKFCRDCGSEMVLALIEEVQRKKCDNCGYIDWEPPVSVGVAVIPAGRLLDAIVLVQRGLPPVDKWCLPAGFLSTGESPSQAAARETLEETNLAIVVPEVPMRIIVPPGKNQILHFFLARSKRGRMKPGSDAKAVAIFREHELPEIAFPLHKEVIAQHFANVRRRLRAG
jgi:ADP-ribose pyrophosphatase YjhB (NUDIX family)/ribosomal protein S27AE